MKISDEEYRLNEGKIIGNYLILKYVGRNKRNIPTYEVRCIKCDYETIMGWPAIKQSIGKNSCTHPGIWYSERLKNIYNNMIARCYKPYCYEYYRYGGKGITVCDEWLKSSWKFNDWALANGYRDDLSLDRIDSSKGYYPENCRFIPLSDNSKWRSNSHYVSVNGELDTCKGWGKRLGMGESTIGRYLRDHGYEETAFHIAEIQNPDKIIVCVQLDQDMYYNKERKRI